MIYWASLEYISGTLLGVEYHNNSAIYPVWVCLNISARTDGVSSLMSNTDLATKLADRWNKAFDDYGSTYADKYGIPAVIACF